MDTRSTKNEEHHRRWRRDGDDECGPLPIELHHAHEFDAVARDLGKAQGIRFDRDAQQSKELIDSDKPTIACGCATEHSVRVICDVTNNNIGKPGRVADLGGTMHLCPDP